MHTLFESSLDRRRDMRNPHYQELKGRVHQELLDRLNLERLDARQARGRRAGDPRPDPRRCSSARARRRRSASSSAKPSITDVLHEIFGLGPLEMLLQGSATSRTSWSTGTTRSTSSAKAQLEETDIVFQDDAHLLRIIERIVSMVGRRIDESSPMVDARLQDGSRVNAIIPPLALDGPVLSIRRFRTDRIGAQDLVGARVADAADARFPQGAVAAG